MCSISFSHVTMRYVTHLAVSINTCSKFLNCQWWRMAIIRFQKGSGKMVKSQGKVIKQSGNLQVEIVATQHKCI